MACPRPTILLLLMLGVSLVGVARVSACADWKQALELHNAYRALHPGTPALVYNATLAAQAQAWSKTLVTGTTCTLKSSDFGKRGNAGENLYAAFGSKTPSCVAATKMFYSGASKYKYTSKPWTDNAKQFNIIGQFTQVVWKGSRQFGCGSAVSPSGCYVVTCRYSPSGNIITDSAFRANVLPPRSSAKPPLPKPVPAPSPKTRPSPPVNTNSTCVDKYPAAQCAWAVTNKACDKFWLVDGKMGAAIKDTCAKSCKACPTGRRLLSPFEALARKLLHTESKPVEEFVTVVHATGAEVMTAPGKVAAEQL